MTILLDDTIYALSSGPPPAALAVLRISGPAARMALVALAGRLPPARRASLRELRRDGALLDRALVLWFPGPASATGEDLAELHLHGGRAVVAAVTAALAEMPGLRAAQAGEFTRRALYNGRIDLTAAEGLADLLEAETEAQRRAALAVEAGGLARLFADWRARLLAIVAEVEGAIDLAEEAEAKDVLLPQQAITALAGDIDAYLARPPAERLKDGVRVVLAGPVNAGKSTLLNALVGRQVAITAPIPGTTRDVIEAPVTISGLPFVFVDTAGIRATTDLIEAEGVRRAEHAAARADVLLWLGDGAPPAHLAGEIIAVWPRSDEEGRATPPAGRHLVSSALGIGIGELLDSIVEAAGCLLPNEGELALNQRHRSLLAPTTANLRAAHAADDIVLAAEHLRRSLVYMDQLSGQGHMNDVLDAVFARFCVGK